MCLRSGYGCYLHTVDTDLFTGLAGSVAQTCSLTMATGSFIAATCDGEGSIVSTYTVDTATPMFLQAPLIQLAWQASDLVSTAVATSTSTDSASASTTSATSPTSSETAASSSSKSGISGAAAAGIGVAAAIVVLLIAAAVAWLFWKKRRAQASSYPRSGPAAELEASQARPGLNRGFDAANPQSSYGYASPVMVEAPGAQVDKIHELEHSLPVHELGGSQDSAQGYQELPASVVRLSNGNIGKAGSFGLGSRELGG